STGRCSWSGAGLRYLPRAAGAVGERPLADREKGWKNNRQSMRKRRDRDGTVDPHLSALHRDRTPYLAECGRKSRIPAVVHSLHVAVPGEFQPALSSAQGRSHCFPAVWHWCCYKTE